MIIVVILIVVIWLAVLRVYRVATGKLFLKPATNRLEHPSGPISDLLTETLNRGTVPIGSFTNRCSGGLPGRITLGRLVLSLWSLGLLGNGRAALPTNGSR